MAEKADALTSWTRTLNEDDALTLIDAASPGMPIDAWAAHGDGLLPQGSVVRRREQLRMVRDELLDVRDGVIDDTAWLRLFREGGRPRRLGLLYGRLWRERPLVRRAVDELVHPALERSERPLPPQEADRITPEDWDTFLRAVLRADVPHEAFTKTRSTLQSALRAVGVIEIAATRERATTVRRGRPDALAFAWVLARELTDTGERPEDWAVRESFAARLFAPTVAYATSCVEAGVAAGVICSGHLMGRMQLQSGLERSAVLH